MNRIATIGPAFSPAFGAPAPARVAVHAPLPGVGFRSLMRRSAATPPPDHRRDAARPAIAMHSALAKASPSVAPATSPGELADQAPGTMGTPEEDGEADGPARRAHGPLPRLDLGSLAGSSFFAAVSTHPSPGVAEPNARGALSLEELLPALVRRVAWSGDRHQGSVRLEIGEGELDGATLLVHAQGGRVRVQLDVPPGVDARRWQERIQNGLAARGVAADAVEVT